MIRFFLLILLCSSCSAQTVQYSDGNWYSGRQCGRSGCEMCNTIDSMISYAQSAGVSRLTWQQYTSRNLGSPSIATIAVQQYQPPAQSAQYETVTEYVQTGTRKICLGPGNCIYQPIYGLVTRRRLKVTAAAKKPTAAAVPSVSTKSKADAQASDEAAMKEGLELAGLMPWHKLIEVGSGDGRVAIEAVKLYGCSVVGIEIDAELAAESRRAVLKAESSGEIQSGKIEIITADARDVDFSKLGGSHAYVYLMPKVLRDVRRKLESVPVVVSISHEIPGREFAEKGASAYLYRFTDERSSNLPTASPPSAQPARSTRGLSFRVTN